MARQANPNNTANAEPLRGLGFAKATGMLIGGGPGWHARPWRPVWTGRRLIRDGSKPAAVSHKELV
jgi:hypothetical protein